MNLLVGPIGELHTIGAVGRKKKGAAMRDTGKIQNAALAIADGKVVVAGPYDDVSKTYSDWQRLDASNKLVTPGLVDCHTHIVWGGNRSHVFIRRSSGVSYEEIAEEGGGILLTSSETNKESIKALTFGIESRADTMLRSGTTSLEIKASYGLSLAGCKKELDAIASANIAQNKAVTFMAAHAMPKDAPRKYFIEQMISVAAHVIPKKGPREDFIQQIIEEMLPMAAKHPAKPTFNDVFCEEGAFTVEESKQILEAGKRFGLKPKTHSDEFNALGGTEMACALGAASCDHLLAVTDPGIAALANSETVAVVLPGTAFYLGKPYANARKMLDADCVVALGTDFNPGSSMISSMVFVMGLAVTKMNMTPEEAVCAATINSAAAINSKAGTLSAGAAADFCIWPCSSLEELIYEFCFVAPESTFIDGAKCSASQAL